MRIVRATLIIIGIVQIILGVVFLIPNGFASLLGLPEAPAWATWMLTMFAARAFGFGYGMLLAARDPQRHRSWIIAMIGVQAVDWLGTMAYVLTGTLTLATVTTAAFLPLVFIGILWRPSTDAAPAREVVAASV